MATGVDASTGATPEMKKNVRDREPFLLIETGTREDSLGRVVS